MAKGNLFQGMARGKVGDVVFYRMNGWQMSRIRNRRPKNPRTNEQLYQRAIIATTMKAYSAGKEIFDHSFQGYTIGEGCMRRFNSVNARILRSQLSNDIDNNLVDENAVGRFVAPKSLYPVAQIGLQVSEGTIKNTLTRVVQLEGNINQPQFVTVNAQNAGITANEYFEALGISAGDLFTLVAFVTNLNKAVYSPNWSNSIYSKQYETAFGWVRMRVKENIADTITMASATLADVFEIESDGSVLTLDGSKPFRQGGTIGAVNIFNSGTMNFAIIRSRLDQDIRSTEYLTPIRPAKYGISSNNVLEAWKDEIEKIGNSELILEGGEGVTGPSGLPVEDVALNEDMPIAPVPTTATLSKKK